MVRELSQAIEARDPSTRGHSARVTKLAEAVARRLGWDEQRLADLRIGGSLHDVGKLAVAERILRKPGRLDAAELEQIRSHPARGATLIERLKTVHAALPYVLCHHERWDGGGYPNGLRGDDIPVEARLLAIADAFDAMISHRPYRSALSYEAALGELDRCAGTQFDPDLVREFVDVWGGSRLAVASA